MSNIEDILIDLHTQLARIADALEASAHTQNPSPNYRYPFEMFPSFDWSRIGARVIKQDEYGAAVVEWGGSASWVRRYQQPTNTRKESIWFSRKIAAEDDDSGDGWLTLITFREVAEATALPPHRAIERRRPSPPNESMFTDKDRAISADGWDRFNITTQKAIGQCYEAPENVQAIARLIDDGWVPSGENGRMFDALQLYCAVRMAALDERKSLKWAHNHALTEARNAYNRNGAR